MNAMEKIIRLLYKNLPKGIKVKIGKMNFLKPARDMILRPNGKFRESFSNIEKTYSGYDMNFRYYSSIMKALKAKEKGVENTLLENSISLLKEFKSKNDDCVIFDVGSSFGYLTMVWANSISKNGFVHSFEANKKVYDTFSKSIRFNRISKVKINHNAVGSENGKIKMFDFDTSSNIVALHDSDKFDLIDMVTLDTYVANNDILRCDLIKIDVDGIEFDILNGCDFIFNKLKPIFVVETNNDDRIIDLFKGRNYNILDMSLKPLKDLDAIPSNIFCVPKLK